ncbi:VTT domain-containing protein [Desulfatitalea alkaliphila]|uniref:VTT domain-containing protein n=1 Tax=Desulfatitalea alkaliphila TaxID=2929485 RepID=A0AA41ULY2_9BACT|nr:VTT domain-containing protein [Desulfatitalea alkaliphila]MCJ8502036.1 VTT domain-containing protein [Desulfatitalea alkaliphila]
MKDLFKPGVNCGKVAVAHRAAFIVDGEAYYRAVYEALQRARRHVFIIGWDLHSELKLVRDGRDHVPPVRLRALLNHLAAKHKGLHIHLLCWDFAMIYAMEREFLPWYKLQWRTHRRVAYCLDGAHPVGASQHQKLVLIDDCLAFAGGFDLSEQRWDTPAHRPEDARRVTPDGKPYPPFHDVQMAVDGPAARVLAELARTRWAAAGNRPPAMVPLDKTSDPWPPSVVPDLREVPVAVARTIPEYESRAAVREVERLYLDSIAAAQRWIYVENQYLSSHRICQALEGRLAETDGPEVVLVLPERTGGWLEQHTMDILRGRILARLRQADRHDRLRVYCPRISETPACHLMVHAKVMVIDDQVARVGSSNLSNRSMGLDSELDLAVAAGTDERVGQVIAGFRNRLLAEHLDSDVDMVAQLLDRKGSLIATIEALATGSRALVPLTGDVPPEVDQWVPESELLDPEQPVAPEALVDYFVTPREQPSAFRHLLKVLVVLGLVLALAALWRWSPLGAWLDLDKVLSTARWLRQQAATPLLVPLAYVLGGVVVFPVTLMILATVMVFGPWWGLGYALLGAELSAAVLFLLGRRLGRDAVHRFAGNRVRRISRKLSRAGIPTIVTLRIIPVAPFSVINLVAGASEIPFRDFAIGTLIGMLPGIVTMVVLAHGISFFLQRPAWDRFALVAGVLLLAVGGLLVLRSWLKRRHSGAAARRGS